MKKSLKVLMFTSLLFLLFSVQVSAESKTPSKVLDPNTTITDDGEIFLVDDKELNNLLNSLTNSDEQLPYFPSNTPTDRYIKQEIPGEEYDEYPVSDDNVFSPFIIIGEDERYRIDNTRQHPHRAVVHLRFKKPTGSYATCTGAMIGPDTVLTAGHCLYSHGDNPGWNNDFTVYPGRNGSEFPYGEFKVARKISVTGWTQNQNYDHDYGVLKLEEEPNVGFFGFRRNNSVPVGEHAFITGYPGDKETGTMWESSGDLMDRGNPNLVFYEIDTYNGQSGAPVYNDNNRVLAVHSGSRNQEINRGTLINSNKYDNLVRWKFLEQ